MLIAMLDKVKQSTFLLPFFIGAAVCAIMGGFINLVLSFAVIVLSYKLIGYVCKGKTNQAACA